MYSVFSSYVKVIRTQILKEHFVEVLAVFYRQYAVMKPVFSRITLHK